ncbi:MAG: MarR family winged helix-turn-helix transcriptional regulator [Acidimicrobiales bacterium]
MRVTRSSARSTRPIGTSALDVESFIEALDMAQMALRAVSDEALADLGKGLTATQLRLLDQLSKLGESRLIDLAEVLSIAPSTATRICDALADRHLIVRHRRGRDRRELQIALTPTGTELLEAVGRRTLAGWEGVLGRLPAAQRESVAAALRQLTGAAPAGAISA